MAMSKAKQHEFLVQHIRYKIDAIDLCYDIVEFLRTNGDQHPTSVLFGEAKTLRFKNARPVTNPLAEHGFMSCRVMMEFLGIGLNKPQSALADYRRHRPDTVTLQDFNLDLLTTSQVESYFKGEQPPILGLVQTIKAGHKGGAHLTRGGDSLPLEQLSAGCRATRMLVDHYLYEAVNYAAPSRSHPLRME